MSTMAYSSSDSLSTDLTLPQPFIRSIQSDLLKQVKCLKRKISDIPIEEAASICENVKDRILNQEDELQLTKVQNNHRRIQIASELLIGICYCHREKVDFEFMKIVCDVLHVKKYRSISRQLIYNQNLELKWEKDIKEEAKAKIMRFSEEKKDFKRGEKEQERTLNQGQKPRDEEHQISEEITTVIMQEPSKTFIQDLERSESLTEMRSDNIDQLTETSFQMEAFDRTSANLTDLRACTSAEITRLQIHCLNISEENIQENEQIMETSIRETNIEEHTRQDMNQIFQILNDGILNKEIPEINQPESLLNIQNEIPEPPQSRIFDEITEKDAHELEADDDWSLPCLEPTETNKKKNLIIDKQTKIVDYARRARDLNRNINVERVQVYQGPPRIIQSLSIEYLMRTPAFNSSILQDQRNFGINNLYTRHVHSEKRPYEPFSIFKAKRSVDRTDVEQLQEEPTLPRVAIDDVEEEYRSKMTMSSLSRGREVLIVKESIRPNDQDLLVGEILKENKRSESETLNKKSVNESPSRIIQAVQEPETDKISLPNSFQHSTVQQFQGQTVKSKRSLPWFFSIRYNPPSSKLREFRFVEERLDEFWKMCEIQDIDKSITVHQLLTFTEERGVTNLLTLLRILDKLSLQRKFILAQNGEDIVVRPFERPYASQKQYLMLGTEPKY